MAVRTRFAPSPTGFLHIGGARTALFNYLFARHHRGKFILRIEDTDVERSTQVSLQAILDGMNWLGLDWDEGPYLQSSMFEAYRKYAKELLLNGAAYRCFCTAPELEARRKEAIAFGRPPMYDKRCREASGRPGAPYAIRFRVPEGQTFFDDLIKGRISFDNSSIEDLVILRSDSTPTYNLCVVVDDALMEITHVIRGDDHINNTPKQVLLYAALKRPVPLFAHLPMILGSDRTRLSKRHGATSVMAYKDMGILPHALVNYLARLGWSHGDQEIFAVDELVEKFSLENAGKSSGVFNPEKLIWLNQHYIKEEDPSSLAGLLLPFLDALGVNARGDERLPAIVKTLKERSKTLKDMAESAYHIYFKEEETNVKTGLDAVLYYRYDEKAAAKFLVADNIIAENIDLFELLTERLSGLHDFSEKAVEAAFNAILSEKGIKLGRLAQPVRVALTGGTVSPGIFETISAMGKEPVLDRLRYALKYMNEKPGQSVK
ncbi:MAG: glutamate--tRNA ligase [Deltaproteobacteria bacterium]|nr:glutamate--tRNA ligase [Deltaproteobacteria bacterium]